MEVTTDSGAEILSFSKPAMEVTTDLMPPAAPVEKSCQTSASACELYRETIQLGLSQGRNAMGIWQDLVDSYGFRDGYQSVKRFVRKLRGRQSPEARVVIETPPGEELQVDYGSGPMVRDPQSGKYRRTRMFVLTLGTAANRFVCCASVRAPAPGPSCMSRPFGDWAVRRESWF
jgi:transposase